MVEEQINATVLLKGEATVGECRGGYSTSGATSARSAPCNRILAENAEIRVLRRQRHLPRQSPRHWGHWALDTSGGPRLTNESLVLCRE